MTTPCLYQASGSTGQKGMPAPKFEAFNETSLRSSWIMHDDFNVSILFLIFAGVSQALSMAFGPIDVTGHHHVTIELAF